MRQHRSIVGKRIVEGEIAGSDYRGSGPCFHVQQGYAFGGNRVDRFERTVAEIDPPVQACSAGSEIFDRNIAIAVNLAVDAQAEGRIAMDESADLYAGAEVAVQSPVPEPQLSVPDDV